MSEGRRAYDILRGYLGREWDRITGVDYESAEQELEEALRSPRKSRPSEDEHEYVVTTRELREDEKPAYARRLLGVPEGAEFSVIRKKYVELTERADPARFPMDSVEREQAALIRRRVAWAYQVLTEPIDGTAKRFRSLEID